MSKGRGLSEERHIGWMASENGVHRVPHGWNTAVGPAAGLQLVSAFPDTELVEYLKGTSFIYEIAADGWVLDSDGRLPRPERPGLGITLNMDALEKCTGVKNFPG